ncbi:flavodoxin domain-containing protein [Leucobacter allii]|uniref:Flavodoxin domain-containing protein n=1 Tax=Leucobacter allii TaxID=2932247 RepID=A0ABY4FP33_9MICO|nr:flavodoxin domain-containing protein [Leucobacter allii]UOQ58046.1 flavodoxin domain-containing protein [Leucobacter allii]UOR02683.1 flavodoxin domain-containing protein [Leucobacter allii]
MNITILFGTESGNSELVAEDLGAELGAHHDDVEVRDLQSFDPSELSAERFYLVICSTHGEGDLPNTAIPFAEAFDAAPPELAGVRYAMFGLGDMFYEETYSQGSEHLDRRFAERGAVRVGEYGRHDASSWDLPSDAALAWLPGVLAAASVPA